MAFKRRKFTKRVRTFKKRGAFKRKPMRKRSSYDGVVNRIIYTSTLVKITNNSTDMRVWWGNQLAAPPVATDVSLYLNPEFVAFRNMFNKYRINGVKMVWRPILYQGGGAAVAYDDLEVATETRVAGANYMPSATLRQKDDFRHTGGLKIFSKYVSVKKYNKRQMAPEWYFAG